MRKAVFIFVVFFLAGPAYAFDGKPRTYVSISLDERQGGGYAWGVGTSSNSSLSVAFSTTDCMLRGGLNCKLAYTFSSRCVALVLNPQGYGHGAGAGDSIMAANSQAYYQCALNSGYCFMAFSRCYQ